MVQMSSHVGWASNANHKIRGSKVMAEKHGANAMGIHGNHSVSWRETGASRFRPTQRSVNCCNIASFLHKTCKATSLPIIVCCVQRMQHAQRVSTFTADAQLLPRVFAPCPPGSFKNPAFGSIKWPSFVQAHPGVFITPRTRLASAGANPKLAFLW